MRIGRDDQQPVIEVEAFEALFEQWSERVYRYLIHLMGPGGETDDIFQDTWMKAIEHRRQLRDPQRFGSWIYRIARNLAYNHSRTHRRKGQVWIFSNLPAQGDPGDNHPLEEITDRTPGPRQQVIDRERRQILCELLAELDRETQEMVQLRFFEGLTMAEVGRVLGVPLGTVCTKTHRALKTIRHRLERQGHAQMGTI